MDSVTNKTQLAEKRYRDERKKDKKEVGLNNKKHKKQNKKIRKSKEDFKKYNHQFKKQKSRQNYKRKNNMS